MKISIDLDKDKQCIEHKNKRYHIQVTEIRNQYCACGCGKIAVIKSKYYSSACRTRAWRFKNQK